MKRQVWLNLMTGEFSDSWEALDPIALEVHLQYSKDHPETSHWKLIEYECLTDGSFEFYKQMKLR